MNVSAGFDPPGQHPNGLFCLGRSAHLWPRASVASDLPRVRRIGRGPLKVYGASECLKWIPKFARIARGKQPQASNCNDHANSIMRFANLPCILLPRHVQMHMFDFGGSFIELLADGVEQGSGHSLLSAMMWQDCHIWPLSVLRTFGADRGVPQAEREASGWELSVGCSSPICAAIAGGRGPSAHERLPLGPMGSDQCALI